MTFQPAKLIRLYNHIQWEEFIEEWLDQRAKDAPYVNVEKVWWANDKWRDIIAYISHPDANGEYEWDCYQCKHYGQGIRPTDIYVEAGKILYYTFQKDYPIPKNYFIAAPMGIGMKLSDLLRTPKKFKEALLSNWKDYCEDGISESFSTPLLPWSDFESYVHKFDYSIFKGLQIKTVLEQYSKSPKSWERFPHSFQRPAVLVPQTIWTTENRYVDKLLWAYENHSGKAGLTVDTLSWEYSAHFRDSRKCFHYAEQLRLLNRDGLPWHFELFQEEIRFRVALIDWLGFEKVKKVESTAMDVTILSNPFEKISGMKDKRWICHQLSNEDQISWE